MASSIPEDDQFRKNDTSIAHKAICLHVELSGLDKSVAAALLSHYNRKSGRCDPSNGRLASLLGIDARQIRRATSNLCKAGLFEKVSHGGRSSCARYTPVWVKFRAIVDDWDRRFASGEAPLEPDDIEEEQDKNVRDVGQKRPPPQDKNVLQTPLENPFEEPKAACGNGARADNRPSTERLSAFKGLLSGNAWPLPRPGPEVALVGEARRAAENAAMRRWDRDLMALGVDAHAYALDLITPEIADEVTSAEKRRHGDGLRLLRERLNFAPPFRGDGLGGGGSRVRPSQIAHRRHPFLCSEWELETKSHLKRLFY